MADTAVLSPTQMPSREHTEDVEMMDDTAPPTQAEASAHDPRADASSNGRPTRLRPKLDLSSVTDAAGSRKSATGERRKGKSIFGVVLGTLNRAKIEDKQRMASEAAKKRQEIDARLQAKLAREQDIVRKQDESRKDQIAAKRKQEDLSIKDSILKHRASTVPDFANFLLTSDNIPQDVDMDDDDNKNIPLAPKSSHPPALYYLPKILTPSQEAFIAKRRKVAEQRVAEEKAEWDSERRKGLDEVRALKEASDSARAKASDALRTNEDDRPVRDTDPVPETANGMDVGAPPSKEQEMLSVEKPVPASTSAPVAAESEPTAMEGVDDDAVEY